MAGNVGHISVSVRPDDFAAFRAELKANLDKIEKRYHLRIKVKPDVQYGEFKAAGKTAEKAVGDVHANVKSRVDIASARKVQRQLQALHAAKERIGTNVVDFSDLFRSLKGLEGRVRRVSKIPILMDVPRLQKQIDGITMWKHVGAVWDKDSLRGLKDTFYRTFPDLKPWVWPQLDTAHVKDIHRRLSDGFKNLKVEFDAKVRAQWANGERGVRKDLGRALTGMSALISTRLDNSQYFRDLHRLTRQAWRDATIPIRPIWDKSAQVRVAAQIARFKRTIRNSDGKVSVKAAWNNTAELRTRARLFAFTKTLGKGAVVRVRITTDGLGNIYKLYRQLGLRSVIRWKVQLEIREAQRAIKALAKIIKRTMLTGAIVSGLSMMGTAILSWIGSLIQALKQVGPALLPAIGVFSAAAAGLGVMAVALKDAQRELAALAPLLEQTKKSISEAFWGQAKVPILETATRLLTVLSPQINQLATAMGGFTAHVAAGVDSSMSHIGGILASSAEGFDILGPAAERATQAILKMMEAAASFFPDFAQWLDELSIKFETWVAGLESGEGGLRGWMEDGITAAQDLGNVIMNLFGIIGDMATLAAGSADDMGTFNDRLVSIRETIATPEFQTGMGAFFEQVKAGSAQITSSLGGLIASISTYGDEVGGLVAQFGGLGSSLIDTLGQALINPAVLGGVSSLVAGFQELFNALSPVIVSFSQSLGPILGQIGDTLAANSDGFAEFAGHLANLALVSFENIGNLSAAVLPVVLDIMNQIGPSLTEFVSMLLPQILSTLDMILPVLQEVGGEILQRLLEALIGIAPTLFELIDRLLPPLLDLFTALAPLIMTLVEIGLDMLNVALQILTPLLEGVANAVSTLLVPAFEFLEEALSIAWQFLQDTFGTIGDWFSERWESVKEIFSGFFDWFSETWNGLIEGAKVVWDGILEGIKAVWEVTWTAISTFFMTIWNAISTFFSTIWNVITTVVSTAINIVSTVISTVLNTISSIWNSIWNTISSVASSIWNGIKGAIETAINIVSSTISTVLGAIESTWNSIWNGISSFVSDTWDSIVAIWDGAVATVSKIFDTIGDAIKKPFEMAFNGIKSLWNNTVGKISFTVPDWVPGIGGKGFSMPKLAEGGIITAPTIALIGEASIPGGGYVPEAVVPLPKLQPMINTAVTSALKDRKRATVTHIGTIEVTIPLEDLRQLRTLEQFVDMLPVNHRMKVGV